MIKNDATNGGLSRESPKHLSIRVQSHMLFNWTNQSLRPRLNMEQERE